MGSPGVLWWMAVYLVSCRYGPQATCHLTTLKPALDCRTRASQLDTAMQLSGVGQCKARSLYTVRTQAAFCQHLC